LNGSWLLWLVGSIRGTGLSLKVLELNQVNDEKKIIDETPLALFYPKRKFVLTSFFFCDMMMQKIL